MKEYLLFVICWECWTEIMMMIATNSLVRQKEGTQGEEKEEEVRGRKKGEPTESPTPGVGVPIDPTRSGMLDAWNRREHRRWCWVPLHKRGRGGNSFPCCLRAYIIEQIWSDYSWTIGDVYTCLLNASTISNYATTSIAHRIENPLRRTSERFVKNVSWSSEINGSFSHNYIAASDFTDTWFCSFSC